MFIVMLKEESLQAAAIKYPGTLLNASGHKSVMLLLWVSNMMISCQKALFCCCDLLRRVLNEGSVDSDITGNLYQAC